MSEAQFFHRRPEFETENVVMFPAESGAGRDPTNVGKVRVNVQLLFNSRGDVISWMRSQDIPTEAVERHER